MKKRMIAAFLAAFSLVVTGCGSGAGMAAEDDSRTGQESQNTQERDNGSEGRTDGAFMQDGSQKEQDEGEASGSPKGQEDADGGQISQAPAESEPDPFAGKTVSILGDSISTFRDYNPEGYAVFFPDYGEVKAVADTWWQRAVDEFSLCLYVNGSSSGATVAGDSTGTEDPACACNELRTGALTGPEGACPEIIFVYLGTNDLLKAIPLGTNDGTVLVEEGEVKTFSDAYTLMIDKLQSKYPPAEIYCCTLLPVGDYGTKTPYVDFVNGNGLTAADYSGVIVQIAQNRGLFVVNLQNCGITVDNLQEMTTDGVHPTPAGMACITEAVAEAFAAGQQ